MGFFAKKDQERDGEFPQLTLKQGEKMRKLCEDAFVKLGISVNVLSDRVLVVDSTRGYGLETVARIAAEAPEREWKNAIAEYFARLVAEGERVDIDELPAEQLLERTRAKIIDPATITQEHAEAHFNYTQWVARLPLLMAFDGEESITYLRDEHVDRIGHEQAWDAARKNLMIEGCGTPEQATSEDGGSLFAIMSESNFQATWLAYPQELLDALGFKAGPLGVFMTVPAATALNLHVVNEGTSIADLIFMATLTAAQHERMPHPLSPHIYWWNGSYVQPITVATDSGLAMELPEELEVVLSR
ncbi:hypothetical protein [Arthrobacter sp. NPDC058127]|uniref:hypothetical protein n=1 Tax=Arthrobacter sp. NPDC058127 TaxID=3346351 RepID=UPI0036E5238F